VCVPEPVAVALPAGATTVLVIDDDPAVHDVLKRYLSKEGFGVVGAAGGADGVRVARELRPDAIVLDVKMPSMDGWAVLTGLKADAEVADVPVITLSIVEEKELGFALGASDYLTKPIDRDRLLGVLEKYRREQASGKVLVVEDDPATRQMLRRLLEREQWAVAEAENGRVALAHVAADRPSLILFDLMMPEMDGFEFVAELHKQPDWRDPDYRLGRKGRDDRGPLPPARLRREDAAERLVQPRRAARRDPRPGCRVRAPGNTRQGVPERGGHAAGRQGRQRCRRFCWSRTVR
jgi:CheY-like chemotaxis protein